MSAILESALGAERRAECIRQDAAAMVADPLDRCKQIRNRVAELEAEIKSLTIEHNALLGAGVVDADDMAWATGSAPSHPQESVNKEKQS